MAHGKWYHSEGPYSESKKQYECVLFYVDGLYREEVVFEIEYEMNNAVFLYNDCSELYLSMYSGDTIKYLDSFKGQILISNDDMPSYGNYEVTTYGTNDYSFDYDESYTANPGYYTFSFNLEQSDLNFKSFNQYLEFDLISYDEDKNIFAENANINYYSDENVLEELIEDKEEYFNVKDEATKNKFLIMTGSLILVVLLITYTSNRKNNLNKKYNIYNAVDNIIYYRDIPSDLDPNFAANLVFCKDKDTTKAEKHGYSAIIMSLVRKGYIELIKSNNKVDWNSYSTKIVIKNRIIPRIEQLEMGLEPQNIEIAKQDLEPLTKSEELYFELIQRHAVQGEITVSKLQSKVSKDYQNTNTFIKNIKTSVTDIGITQGYFQKSNYNEVKDKIKAQSKMFITIGIILTVIVNLISNQTHIGLAYGAYTLLGLTFIGCGIYIGKIAGKYVLLTQFGEDEYSKWRGLYNFLSSQTLMDERTIVELPIWEKYLVYATAFGISEKVIKALKIRCVEIEHSQVLINPYFHTRSFYHYGRSFSHATHVARSTYNHSRFSGYGGGRGGRSEAGGGH